MADEIIRETVHTETVAVPDSSEDDGEDLTWLQEAFDGLRETQRLQLEALQAMRLEMTAENQRLISTQQDTITSLTRQITESHTAMLLSVQNLLNPPAPPLVAEAELASAEAVSLEAGTNPPLENQRVRRPVL